ncbi:MAG: hypothetical protein VYE04_17720 [Pseudomonadota bacterium]|nr:hypothetical protein [Pseudomonadota bacterium]
MLADKGAAAWMEHSKSLADTLKKYTGKPRLGSSCEPVGIDQGLW